MATFESPLFNLPPSSFSETLWSDWTGDSSLSGQDEEDLKFDPSWHSAGYSLPGYYSSFDEWSDQSMSPVSPTGDSFITAQFPVQQPEVASLLPPLDTVTPSIIPAAAILPSSPSALISPGSTLSDRSSISSGTTSDHSSSDSGRTVRPARSKVSKRRGTRNTKGPVRCWEHSCEGRAFSSLGNYERHLREKSGQAKSFTCENCSQRFTRSTAKNKHLKFGRCRGRQAKRIPTEE